ncbi:hypothetical protein JYK02_32765 [Corallococcus macrosporus]|uniref:Uncharacterized protein n=1 Tax=Corallococcus macrosporus TaxID=35 RepID=A0ABS3DLX6_9BACT|nr:hypothetical protein [Corallococcus macrosporus]MBN8232295.1 hypothetical protein [Corallococcus macrosporus]
MDEIKTPPAPATELIATSEIYPTAPDHAVPEPLPLSDFYSWHLPRKQWVRRKQWAATAEALMDAIVPLDRPFRYLGLPGTELLDLEVLAETCIKKNTRLKYIGFNSGAQSPGRKTTQQLAEQALIELDVIEQPSTVLVDDISTLGSATSIATRRIKEFESFDLVNLDFCDVFSGAKENPKHTAVKSIVEFQLNRRTQPWLMYLTTAIAPHALDGADLNEYRLLFERNTKDSEEFGRLLGAPELAAIPIGSGDPFLGAAGVRLGRLLTVGVGKWLLALLSQSKGWILELKSCVCYRRGLAGGDAESATSREPDLFSLVFGFRKNTDTISDPTGLARGSPASSRNWIELETKAAIQIATRTLKSIDLDATLETSEDLALQMLDESARMLRLRNYDEKLYREWVAGMPAGFAAPTAKKTRPR